MLAARDQPAITIMDVTWELVLVYRELTIGKIITDKRSKLIAIGPPTLNHFHRRQATLQNANRSFAH